MIKDIAESVVFALVVGVVMGLIRGLSALEWLVLLVGLVIVGSILGAAWHVGRRFRS